MMDSYLGYDIGDTLAQKDQVYFDRLPSPDSWSNWGVSTFGNSEPPYYDDGGKMLNELSNERPLYQFGADLSYGSSSHVGPYEDSRPWNRVPSGCSDLHIDGLTGTESMDDMFLSSLIHDDAPATAHNCYAVNLPSHSGQPAMMSDHSDHSGCRNLDVQKNMHCDADAMGSSLVFRCQPFSTSAGSVDGRSCVSNVSHDYNSLDQIQTQSVKAQETMDMLLSDQVLGDEDSSTQESVLLGLEAVVSQLSSKTRLCFRDSLYRLAQRSQPSTSAEVSAEFLSFHRIARTPTGESETNTIDRTVANLMFQNPNGQCGST